MHPTHQILFLMMSSSRLVALVVLVIGSWSDIVEGKANANLPHYHRGVLPRYEIGPPDLKLSASEAKRLQDGETIMQAILIDLQSGKAVGSAGSSDADADVQGGKRARRLLMVKDICAPQSIITERLLDYEAYPRMVKGCDVLQPYARFETKRSGRQPLQTLKAKYSIHALHMRFNYFMVHEWAPDEGCMVFYLDYDKRSDMDDSVGYWYLQSMGPERCRVYYSCVTRLRTWVPGPVYKLLTKTACKQATVWIDHESVKAWAVEKARRLETNKARRLVRGLKGLGDRTKLKLKELQTLPQQKYAAFVPPPSKVRLDEAARAPWQGLAARARAASSALPWPREGRVVACSPAGWS